MAGLEAERLDKSKHPGRTIKLKSLLRYLLIITVFFAVFFGYLYTDTTGKAIKPEQQPKYLFSIYGNENKPLNSPMGVYVDPKGNIYVSSTANHEIQVFRPNGQYAFSFGQPGTKPGDLAYPYGITRNARGNLLIAETGNQRIQEFTPDGNFVGITASASGPVKVEKPGALHNMNNKIYICDLGRNEVTVLDEQGKVVQTLKNLNCPHGVSSDEAGKIYVSDSGNTQIVIFDPEGRFHKSISWQEENRYSILRGLARDGLGRIFAVDSNNSLIRVFDQEGRHLFNFGAQGFDKGEFFYPTGIFIDTNYRIYIADWANNRVEVWGY